MKLMGPSGSVTGWVLASMGPGPYQWPRPEKSRGEAPAKILLAMQQGYIGSAAGLIPAKSRG